MVNTIYFGLIEHVSEKISLSVRPLSHAVRIHHPLYMIKRRLYVNVIMLLNLHDEIVPWTLCQCQFLYVNSHASSTLHD